MLARIVEEHSVASRAMDKRSARLPPSITARHCIDSWPFPHSFLSVKGVCLRIPDTLWPKKIALWTATLAGSSRSSFVHQDNQSKSSRHYRSTDPSNTPPAERQEPSMGGYDLAHSSQRAHTAHPSAHRTSNLTTAKSLRPRLRHEHPSSCPPARSQMRTSRTLEGRKMSRRRGCSEQAAHLTRGGKVRGFL